MNSNTKKACKKTEKQTQENTQETIIGSTAKQLNVQSVEDQLDAFADLLIDHFLTQAHDEE